jgi:hypothetical protein
LSKSIRNDNCNLSGTGSTFTQEYKTIVYPFDMYEIVVKISQDGKFIGIEEVRVNKSFRDYKNKGTFQPIFSEIETAPQNTEYSE